MPLYGYIKIAALTRDQNYFLHFVLQGSDASRFQLSMINRQSYTSAVAGILSATNLEKTILLSKFCCEVDNTAESAKKKAFAKREMKM